MRPEKLYLTDIVEAASSVEEFCQGIEYEQFVGDEMRRSAVLQKLIVMGEAANRIPKSFSNSYPGIPWADVIGFRNVAVHEYFSVDWKIVWVTATEEVPRLKLQVVDLLKNEFPE